MKLVEMFLSDDIITIIERKIFLENVKNSIVEIATFVKEVKSAVAK